MIRLSIWLLAATLVLAGCATKPPEKPVEQPDERTAAYQLLAEGDFYAAARHFTRLAATAEPPQRFEYQLSAAEALFRAGLPVQAAQILEGLPAGALPPRLAMGRQLLLAEMALETSPERALIALTTPASDDALDLSARYHYLRAQAFNRLGNHLETARELIFREPYLNDPWAVEANQMAIWQALSSLSNEALGRLRVQPPPDVLSGWMELALIAKDHTQSTQALAERVGEWRGRYPAHPVREGFVEALLKRSRELIARPSRIAVLLPVSGRFSSAAAAIRDGILAAYYSDPGHGEVQLSIYDTGDDPLQAESTYRRAVDEGAEFVIGPLDKESVRLLAQAEELLVPTLALNYSEPAHSPLLYQFSLSPEDEAEQVAELAWLEGHSRASVLLPKGPLGERLMSAFAARWQDLGGEVASTAYYDPENSDYSAPLTAILNLRESEGRRQSLQRILGQRLEFTPRRRQDIDFIFLAAFSRQARLIRPQLRFHYASDVPVYATSHLFTGAVDVDQDRDMDGIVFGDMPWTLEATTPNATTRKGAKSLLNYGGPLQRLVAFGVDAYNLIAAIRLLDSYGHDRFQGETGTLRLDETKRVRRQLLWARFKGGAPRLLNSVVDESPRL